MADFANKRCPSCGKRPADRRLVQCPDCRVPFEYDREPAPSLTPAQLAAVTRQVLGSWILWAVVIILVALAGGGIYEIVSRKADGATEQLKRENQRLLAAAADQVTHQVSNQIAAQFEAPAIRAAIEQVVTQKSAELLTNAVWPSLQAFRDSLTEAHVQLARTTNDLSSLSNDVKQAQQAAARLASTLSDDPPLLHLVNQTVTHNDTNLVLTLFFRPTNNKPMSDAELMAGTFRQTAKISGFTARNVAKVSPPVLNDLGDAARLNFTPARSDTPIIVELQLTAPTIVKLLGDPLEEELTLPVEADKMQIPLTSRQP